MTLTGLSLWFCFISVSDRGDLSTQFQYFIAINFNSYVSFGGTMFHVFSYVLYVVIMILRFAPLRSF